MRTCAITLDHSIKTFIVDSNHNLFIIHSLGTHGFSLPRYPTRLKRYENRKGKIDTKCAVEKLYENKNIVHETNTCNTRPHVILQAIAILLRARIFCAVDYPELVGKVFLLRRASRGRGIHPLPSKRSVFEQVIYHENGS